MPQADWGHNEPVADEPREIREARFCAPLDLVYGTGCAVAAIMANNTDWERVQVMGTTILVPLALGVAAAEGLLSAARQSAMLRNYGKRMARKSATA